MQIVLEALTKNGRRKALENLPPNLEVAFDSTIERVNKQQPASAKLAMNVFAWIHLAEEPLTVDQLLHALATKMDDEKLNDEKLDDEKLDDEKLDDEKPDPGNFIPLSCLLDCCWGLVVVEDKTSTIRFVHYSLQEYFKRKDQSENLFQRRHERIAETCLTYLMFEAAAMDSASQLEGSNFDSAVKKLHFFKYASRHWAQHARKGYPLGKKAVGLIQRYLSLDSSKRRSSTTLFCDHIGYNGSAPEFSPAHILAHCGLHQLFIDVPSFLQTADSKDSHGRTPLSWAAERGHEVVVKLLAEKGADVESTDPAYGRTPLSWAAMQGHEAVVKLLLEKGADMESKNYWGRTPLSWAAENGREGVMKLLLKEGADVESKDNNSRTLLLWAAEGGHEAVVKLLVERTDLDVNCKDKFGKTALSSAAGGGHGAVVRLLLEKGASIDSKDTWGRTPLWWAAYCGHKAVVQLLLEKGADVKSKDRDGWTPLFAAAGKGYEGVAQLLRKSLPLFTPRRRRGSI